MITEVIDQIVDAGLRSGDRDAIRHPSGRSLTYREFADSIRSVTAGLIDSGLHTGATVLLAAKPSIETLVLAISIVRAGGLLVPFSPYGGQALAQARLAALRPGWIVSSATTLLASRIGLARRFLARRGLSLPDLTDQPDCNWIYVDRRWPGTPHGISLSRLQNFSRNPALPALPPDATSIAVFTSGTTSDPKAVVHTNRSSGESVRISADLLELDEGDVVLTDSLHALLPTLLSGAVGYINRRPAMAAGKWIADVHRSNATVLFTTPAQLQHGVDYLRQHRQRIPPSVRKIVIGSAPVHPALFRDLRSVVGPEVRVMSVYAMTEILPVALVSAERKLEFTQEGDLVGKPVKQVQLKLTADSELVVSGPHLFDRYLNGPQVSEHRTGDLARLLPSGEIVLLGRKKDMIIRRAENIYPSLYEPTINGIPGVRQCALIGLPNAENRDEMVVLVVEPEPGESGDAVRRRVTESIVSGPYSIDRLAHPDVVVSMPIPASGRSQKIDRARLKNMVKRDLQCASQSPAPPGS